MAEPLTRAGTPGGVETRRTDLLIIGSGIAGFYAALKASAFCRVTVLAKETLGVSNTQQAQGGIAASLAGDDSPGLHMEDTMAAGAGLCQADRVELLVREGRQRVRELLTLGVPFDREEGVPALTMEGAHSRRRILHAGGDATGRVVWESLAGKVRQAGCQVLENQFAIDLVLGENRCLGAMVLDAASGRVIVYRAKATILATGGSGQIYPNTTNNLGATGDGVVMAYRAGVELSDLEFFQFHPTTLYHSESHGFLISEAVRGEGAILKNRQGERFMTRVHPAADLAPRDVVARAILAEMRTSGDPCVFLDATALGGSFFARRFPTIYQRCRELGLDPAEDWLPVVPAAHYQIGGVVTDSWGQTCVPGLFACGEVACSGVHGANRLASNSLLEGLVFAARIVERLEGGQLGRLTMETVPPVVKSRVVRSRLNGTAEAVRRQVQEIMLTGAGMERSADGLSRAEGWLEQLAVASDQEQVPAKDILEVDNMLVLAKLMVRAALLREESRGTHFRTDFPRPDPGWARHIVLRQDCQPEVREWF